MSDVYHRDIDSSTIAKRVAIEYVNPSTSVVPDALTNANFDSGIGETTDAAVTGDNDGSLSGKLRGMLVNWATLITNIGSTTDAAATGNGSLIGVVKQLRTLLGGIIQVQQAALSDLVDFVTVKLKKGTAAWTTVAPDTTVGGTVLKAANTSRLRLNLINVSSVTVYVGPSGVTTATGIPLDPRDVLTDDLSSDAWYGITAAGTGSIRVREVS